MQLRLILATKSWQARWPQAGTADGWAEWETIPRVDALNFIERGFSFNTI